MKRILIILLFVSGKLFSQDTCRFNRDGFAVQIGTMGFSGEYQIFVKDKLWFTPFATINLEMGANDISGVWLGYSFGANMEFGKKNRIILGLNYGTHGVGYDSRYENSSDSSQKEFVNKHVLVGTSLITGYKEILSNGLLWQIYFGLVYKHNPIGDNKKYFFGPTAGIGVGYKF